MTYSGSQNSYFKQLPELDYPSLANDRKSAYDYQIVKKLEVNSWDIPLDVLITESRVFFSEMSHPRVPMGEY